MVSWEDGGMIDDDDVDLRWLLHVYCRLVIASPRRANCLLLVRGVGYFGGGTFPFFG